MISLQAGRVANSGEERDGPPAARNLPDDQIQAIVFGTEIPGIGDAAGRAPAKNSPPYYLWNKDWQTCDLLAVQLFANSVRKYLPVVTAFCEFVLQCKMKRCEKPGQQRNDHMAEVLWSPLQMRLKKILGTVTKSVSSG